MGAHVRKHKIGLTAHMWYLSHTIVLEPDASKAVENNQTITESP